MRLPRPLEWNFCPTCGVKLVETHDGQSHRPHCADCYRFFYHNPIPAACCFVRRNEDELLFVQRSVEPRKGLWTLPGGFVETGETTAEAAIRELEEETALIGKVAGLVGASSRPSRLSGGIVVLGYLVDEWEGDPVADTDAMDLGFFTKENRPEIAFEVHRDLIATYDRLVEAGALPVSK